MLESALRNALAACGHEPESRPFRAHITLARKLRDPVGEAIHASARASSAIAPGIALPPASLQSCFALTHPSLDSPIRWSVSDFHLVASDTLANGARYRPLASWPLE